VSYTDGLGTTHSATVAVTTAIPTNLYSWKALEWYRNRVSDRLAESDIRYSSKENTITITKKGAQNIALRYREQKYMEPGMKYLVAVATEVSKDKGDSQLWHINGKWVNIQNPADVRTLKDGRIMVAWSIDENKGYELTGETVFGLTSTNAQGRSVISYVGFTSDLEKTEKALDEAVGISLLPTEPAEPQAIYALDGTLRPRLRRGMNIISANGHVTKVYSK
jgi:alpha-D-xyloside xylohydrolase